jgi:hypothetical protein
MAWRSVRQIASRMPAGSQRHYRHRHVFVHCGQSLQSMIPIKVIEAIEREIAPSALKLKPDRSTRTAVRVALRQLKSAGLASDTLNAWQNEFDVIDSGEDDDAERMHQN